MSFVADLRTWYRLLLAPIRGATLQDRLESFYGPQAQDYDRSRARLLHGREALYRRIPVPDGGTWIEMGGGTAANLEFLGERLANLRQVYIVDLATSLLAVARRRIAERGWANVVTLPTDARDTGLPPACADVVTFSYSLTMIPDWYLAVEHAGRLLKPGGLLAVVDFYVSRKHPPSHLKRHSAFTRWFWPWWFASDNVFLSADHLPYLLQHFHPLHVGEHRGRLAWLPGVCVPYYEFLGSKQAT